MLNHALRYAQVVETVEHDRRAGKLLEVGSGSRGIAAYLAGSWDVTACDLGFDDYGAARVGSGRGVTRITASALELPFADGDFDTVVALDLLEHIPPADRPAALLELRRVAGKRLIVGCPCDAAAEEADRSLLGVYERVGRPVPGWLSEHLAHGLPRSNELLAASRPGDDVQLLANCTVRSHLRVMTLEAQPVVWRAAAAAGAVSAWMLRQPGVWRRLASSALHALRGRDRAPTYRTIAVITIPGAAA